MLKSSWDSSIFCAHLHINYVTQSLVFPVFCCRAREATANLGCPLEAARQTEGRKRQQWLDEARASPAATACWRVGSAAVVRVVGDGKGKSRPCGSLARGVNDSGARCYRRRRGHGIEWASGCVWVDGVVREEMGSTAAVWGLVRRRLDYLMVL